MFALYIPNSGKSKMIFGFYTFDWNEIKGNLHLIRTNSVKFQAAMLNELKRSSNIILLSLQNGATRSLS
jgi:hypothetical protein